MSEHVRSDGRQPGQLRPIRFLPGIAPHATGSVLVEWGNTRVICAVTVEESVPKWMQSQKVPGGWLTAEYSMLPYSTLDRKPRDISKLKLDGRSQEIQRLVGRSLRAGIDLVAFGPRTAWVDCDVLQADGGTRTAAISGAYVALAHAVRRLQSEGRLSCQPLGHAVAAVSLGIVGGIAGFFEHLGQAVRSDLGRLGPGTLFGRLGLFGHLQADLLGQVLDGLDEAHAGVVHQKADGIAVLAAAKAVVELLGRADAEAG